MEARTRDEASRGTPALLNRLQNRNNFLDAACGGVQAHVRLETLKTHYFSLSKELSNCSNSGWRAVTVSAGPVNLMNTLPSGPSTMAPSRR